MTRQDNYAKSYSQPPVVVNTRPTSNLKEVVIYSAVGLVLIGGTIFLTSKFAKNAISKAEEKKALETDSATSYAKQIKMAFDNDGWWGTDEVVLRNTLRSIPSKAFYKDVAGSYKRLYNSALTADMQSELTSTEYEEMLMIIASKPEKEGGAVELNYLAWAKRIRNAVSVYYGIFPGTDEEAIKAVLLEIPTQDAFQKVQTAYFKEYGDALITDLQGDLSQSYLDEFTSIVKKKPKA
jgi:hypothetical protein